MTGEPNEHRCKLCGKDCSHRPRVTDTKGQYYCKACLDRLRDYKMQHRDVSQIPPSELSIGFDIEEPEPATPETLAPTPRPILDPDDLSEPPAPAESPLPSPSLAPLPRPSKVPHPKAITPPAAAPPVADGPQLPLDPLVALQSLLDKGPSRWPRVVGGLGLLFGVVGVAFYLFAAGSVSYGLVSMIEESGDDARLVLGAIAGVLGCLILAVTNGWLLIAGRGLVRRRIFAARHLPLWAITKMMWSLVCVAVAGFGFVPLETISWLDDWQLGIASPPGYVWLIIGAWLCILPIALLIWFDRESVKFEVTLWE